MIMHSVHGIVKRGHGLARTNKDTQGREGDRPWPVCVGPCLSVSHAQERQITYLRHFGIGSPPSMSVEWRWEVAHGGAHSEAALDDRGIRARVGRRSVPPGCPAGAHPWRD